MKNLSLLSTITFGLIPLAFSLDYGWRSIRINIPVGMENTDLEVSSMDSGEYFCRLQSEKIRSIEILIIQK